MKKGKIIIFFVMLISVIMVSFGVPSTSYAMGNTLTVKSFTGPMPKDKKADKYFQGVSGTGEIAFSAASGLVDDPFIISLDYDEIVFEESDLMPSPFYYKITPAQSGAYIGKYMVDIKQEENKIIFTKIGDASSPSTYTVTPPRKSEGDAYLQAGAVLDENYLDMADSIPMYKIEAIEIYGYLNYEDDEDRVALINKTSLGNAHLRNSWYCEWWRCNELCNLPYCICFLRIGHGGKSSICFFLFTRPRHFIF